LLASTVDSAAVSVDKDIYQKGQRQLALPCDSMGANRTKNRRFEKAQTLYRERNYQAAEKLFRKLVRKGEKKPGKDHDLTLESKHWLARILFGQWNYAEAETPFRQSAAIPDGNYWRARTLYERKKYAEAEILFRPSITILDGKYWLARILYDQEHYNDAENLFRQSTTILDGEYWLARTCMSSRITTRLRISSGNLRSLTAIIG
jgi:TolA-binding protein